MFIMFITFFLLTKTNMLDTRVRYVIGHWSAGTSNQKNEEKYPSLKFKLN